MKNVQLFEEFVNNLSSNHVNEADAADVYPARPPFQANVKGTDGKDSLQIVTNPAYWVDRDVDSIGQAGLGILKADLPKEYTPHLTSSINQEKSLQWYIDHLVDYCDDPKDETAEQVTYRLLYGTEAYKKKYHPQGIKAGAKGLMQGEKPEEVSKYAIPPLKDLVVLINDKVYVPFVESLRAGYCKDEAMETLGSSLKKANPEFYKEVVNCYKYWMDNVNKAGIKNNSSMAGKPKKPAA